MINKASVIDSSALLALINNETGTEQIKEYFETSYMSVINATECLIVLNRNGMPINVAQSLLESIISKFLPSEYHDMELIAKIKNDHKSLGLSLGDSVCIALGNKLDLQIVTADRTWQKVQSKSKIICIR
ncbi:MAG: PIN domain-containing protein [Rickettsiales bacterium]|nr:PIN domain-containing protein [Rickettsiales bacterium]